MKIKSGLVSLLPLFLAVSALLGMPIPVDPPLPLFKLLPEFPIPPHKPDSSIIREVAVQVDLGLARGDTKTLRFPLFPGTDPLTLTVPNRRVDRSRSVIRSGHVDGQPASMAVLSAGTEVLIANIATQVTKEKRADYYEIRYIGGGRHVLRQIDPSKLPEGSNPISPEEEDSSPDSPTCSTDTASTIDVLVVYTPDASAEAGGSQAMEQTIKVSIDETNESYGNSNILQRLRLVRTAEVPYRESGDPKLDRRRLRRGEKGLDEAHSLRDESGADVVALIVSYNRRDTDEMSCGISYVMKTPENAFEKSAFSIVPYRCAAPGKWGVAHELGHLMGARHDWWEGQTEPLPNKPFPFSHGYVHFSRSKSDPPPYFRTMMAKNTECAATNQACDQVPYWSNPFIKYQRTEISMGKPDTDPEPSDNAKTLNATAIIVANFRCSRN